ncbi:O-antigen ligase family protein [Danxiaibacter flavus]|uniref:O-antigen ligase family protein n=1 Tax=Danxiaibacter flavus TaxID=3049108 RepID=A0ABV3ZA77_9BACT|nr:O-antigen ligase family protein [Chitinophagaceae bacterium DXS]
MNNSFSHVVIPQPLKNIFIIRDTLANKISYYHLLLFLVSLPFDRFYSELVLISFSMHTLLHLRRLRFPFLPVRKLLLVLSLFLITLFTVLYTSENEEGLSKAGRQLALIIFPVMFVCTKLDLNKYKHQLFLAFSLTITLTVIYLYYDALHTIVYNKLLVATLFTPAFINQNFTAPIELHATYMAMYVCFSLLFMIYCALHSAIRVRKVLYLSAAVLLTGALVQLGSRSVLVAAIIGANCILPITISSVKRKIIYLSATITGSAIVVIGITTAPVLKSRYISGFRQDITANIAIPTIPEPRMARWESALHVINQHPLLGYGAGAEIPVLKQQYFKDGLYISYYNELNAHNQYLSMAVTSGYVGLAVFMLILLECFRLALKNRDVMFLSFLVIIAVASFSENILDLNKGIFFIAFFLSFFLLSDFSDNFKVVNELPGRATFERA